MELLQSVASYIIERYGYDCKEYKYHDNMAEYGMSFAEWSDMYEGYNGPQEFAERFWNEASEAEQIKLVAETLTSIKERVSNELAQIEELENLYK